MNKGKAEFTVHSRYQVEPPRGAARTLCHLEGSGKYLLLFLYSCFLHYCGSVKINKYTTV